jgi:hypothetical protein
LFVTGKGKFMLGRQQAANYAERVKGLEAIPPDHP